MNRDIDELQGAWLVRTLEVDGQRVNPDSFPGAKIIISGNRFESLAMGATYAGDIAVDDVSTPKSFSLTFTNGPEKGNINLGIYELAAETWKICLNTAGQARPRAFATGPGSGDALEVLTRER